MSVRRFVALDRDGTVIVERHYLSEPREVELLHGAASGLQRLRDLGLGLILVTNQSAIGRGMFDHERLALIHDRLKELLAEHGVSFDGIFYCPHIPSEGCACRKPRTAMAREYLRASADLKQKVADECIQQILEAASLITETFRGGGKVLLCGNGGSAADCQHMAAEFVSVLNQSFKRRALPAVALTTDSSFL